MPDTQQAKTTCEHVLRDFSGITQILNGRLNVSELHKQVNLFFYIDSSVKAKSLCLQVNDTDAAGLIAYRELTRLHEVVMKKWAEDYKLISAARM